MTRETKIGLLVGLAFIIVIGILLSDHINSSNDPAPAAMGQEYNNVTRSVGSPDQRSQGSVVMVPPPVIPTNQVPTTRDPQPPQNNGSSVIEIGLGKDPSQTPRPIRTDPAPDSTLQVFPPAGNEVAVNDAPAPPPTTPDAGVSGPLSGLVQQHGDELTGVGGPVRIRPTPPANPPASNNSTALPPGVKQVKAEEGDTVTKLAGKYMGGNSKANRDAIIKANPNLGPDGRKLFAGQTYLIPVPAAAQGPVAISQDQPAPRPAPTVAAPPVPAVPAGVTMYTVKDNDSLWKIAAEQLGSGNRWVEIRDLNPDVLKGGEQLHANMRLKLPGKTVASTN